VGQLLATELGLLFCDADSLHSPASIAQMSAGVALDDAARAPWLAKVGKWLHDRERRGGVIACSALARRYRDTLRAAAPETRIALLVASADDLSSRLQQRPGHFMPASLLETQLSTYERPGVGEPASEFQTSDGPTVTVLHIITWLTNADASPAGTMARARGTTHLGCAASKCHQKGM
jgi:gluconokinase